METLMYSKSRVDKYLYDNYNINMEAIRFVIAIANRTP